ncbi:copper chaperone PCu(A)C [Altererythrobacter sp. ZODW24]|uniref:copper chaperone PCu(A)C n=1 Tax=Altererythrobacter sp. ZODW24 TaxID=2185142 RepID=UPI000DF77276|nr:copper chaperone PCu(A)C [Altererythrobacter sp. ZODW24]
MKSKLLAAAALGFATLSLAACGETATEEPAGEVDAMPGVSVENARLILPAVAGNPGAVYFDIKNESDRGASVQAVDVAAAKSAAMHEMAEWSGKMEMMPMDQIMVQPGTTFALEPGKVHIMASDLEEGLASGGSTEVTLTFLGGDKISFLAEIRAAGEAR